MTDLQYSWKFYAHGMLFNPQYSGNLKGDPDQITLDTSLRANAGSSLGTSITIRYSFKDGAPAGYNPSDFFSTSISSENKALFEQVFKEYSSVANITFIEVPQGQNANLEIYLRNTPGGGEAGTLEDAHDTTAMIIGIGESFDLSQLSEDFYKDDILYTIRHELGHILGLDHPRGQDSFLSARDVYNPNSNDIPFEEATDRFTVMSYVNNADFYERGGLEGRYFETIHNTWGLTTNQSLGIFDIKTLQYLYGANTSTNIGDDTYRFRPEDASVLTIYDAGGSDTFDFSNQLTGVKVNLEEASFSSAGYYYTNARLTSFATAPSDLETRPEVQVAASNNIAIAWDTLIENATGSNYQDTLKGNEADNHLKGQSGHDLLVGYGGADTVSGGSGNDTIWAGAGDKGADYVDGGDGHDIAAGGAGNDTVVGGTGNDTLYGGTGDDWIITNGWTDTNHDQTPSATEIDTLSGSNEIAYGGGGKDIIFAGAGKDTLGGGYGDDTIHGYDGADIIYGGKGDGGDVLFGGGGEDIIFAGLGNDTLRGDQGNDMLFGGNGHDILTGGIGTDTLWGGMGDDTLMGGDGADTFAFRENQGHDIIQDFDAHEDILNFTSFGITDIRDFASDKDDGLGGTVLTFTLDAGTSVTLSNYTVADIDTLQIML